jgi:hypothetical protein
MALDVEGDELVHSMDEAASCPILAPWIARPRRSQRIIRAEEAVAASALGRMPAGCPAVSSVLKVLQNS